MACTEPTTEEQNQSLRSVGEVRYVAETRLRVSAVTTCRRLARVKGGAAGD